MTNIKFSEYSIDNLKIFLEKKLFLKLNKIGIKTVGDFEKLSLNEFSRHKGVGTNTIKLFLDFKTYFNKNKISIHNKIKEENELKILPLSEFESEELNFLEELSITAINFCDNTLKVKYSKIFLDYYGLRTNKCSNADIALINNISNERVRQIRIKILKQFIQFINQGIDLKSKIKLREDIAYKLNKIKLDFDNIECFVFKEFKKYISTEFKINFVDNFSNELEFLIDFLNYSFLGKLESQHTKAVIVSTNLKSKKNIQ